MSLFRKIFGARPRGISMGNAIAYEISGITSLPEFLRALPHLLPHQSILYLEGTYATDVIGFLQSHPAIETCEVAKGTIWPRPKFFHLPITAEVMERLAALSERHAEPEVLTHVHAYKEGRVLMEWYDAFFQELWIAHDVSEDRVAEFCRRLGAVYERV